MPLDGSATEKNLRLSYLLDVYKLYQGHINTMFNYFLLTSGLLANAYIQVLQKQAVLSVCVAAFGALMALMSLFIHIRSRELLEKIEDGLELEERNLFSNDQGFLIGRAKHTHWFRRHKYQFRFMYGVVVFGFLAMAIYAAVEVA
jgi:hypothetical protein